MKPARVTPMQFLESTEHRRVLPAGYNLYRRVSGEPDYDQAMDNARMIFYPLHLTAFCIVDALQDSNWHGAEQIIILSASSKTSLGLAFGLHDMEDGPTSVGMTSAKNIASTQELEIYDELHTYSDFIGVDKDKPAVIVDMSGNIAVVNQLGRTVR